MHEVLQNQQKKHWMRLDLRDHPEIPRFPTERRPTSSDRIYESDDPIWDALWMQIHDSNEKFMQDWRSHLKDPNRKAFFQEVKSRSWSLSNHLHDRQSATRMIQTLSPLHYATILPFINFLLRSKHDLPHTATSNPILQILEDDIGFLKKGLDWDLRIFAINIHEWVTELNLGKRTHDSSAWEKLVAKMRTNFQTWNKLSDVLTKPYQLVLYNPARWVEKTFFYLYDLYNNKFQSNHIDIEILQTHTFPSLVARQEFMPHLFRFLLRGVVNEALAYQEETQVNYGASIRFGAWMNYHGFPSPYGNGSLTLPAIHLLVTSEGTGFRPGILDGDGDLKIAVSDSPINGQSGREFMAVNRLLPDASMMTYGKFGKNVYSGGTYYHLAIPAQARDIPEFTNIDTNSLRE